MKTSFAWLARLSLVMAAAALLTACDRSVTLRDPVTVEFQIDTNWLRYQHSRDVLSEAQDLLASHDILLADSMLLGPDEGMLRFFRADAATRALGILTPEIPVATFSARGSRQLVFRISASQQEQHIQAASRRNQAVLLQRARKFDIAAREPQQPLDLPEDRFALEMERSSVVSSKRLQRLLRFPTVSLHLVLEKGHALAGRTRGLILRDRYGNYLRLADRAVATDASIRHTRPMRDRFTDLPALYIRLEESAGEAMRAFTRSHIDRYLAVLVTDQHWGTDGIDYRDARIISVAMIVEPLGERFQLMGLDSDDEVQQLAAQLGAGRLAAPVRVFEPPEH